MSKSFVVTPIRHISWLMTVCILAIIPSSCIFAWERNLPPHPSEAIWILIDTQKQTLDVLRGDQHILGFKRVAIGSGGAALDRRRGDNKTPIGRFRVNKLDSKSKFHVFIGLDYPSRIQIERAWRNKIISAVEYKRINTIRKETGIAPQDTILGGYIGIHGIGVGNRAIHDVYNWTQGCIAVTNAQIDQLHKYVALDTLVVII